MFERRRIALLVLGFGLMAACGPDRDDAPVADAGAAEVGSTKQQLRTNPEVSQFAVYAANSLSLMDRAAVHGGDVGVQLATSGPFLVSGYQAALSSDARIDTDHDLLADRVLLKDRATVGDVEATTLTNQFGSYLHQYPLPSMPVMPSAAPATPGATSFSVASGQTRSMTAGAYGAVSVQGTLALTGGTYDFASLALGNDARLQVLATSQLRVAGRLSTGDRARIEPSGSSLTAKDVRLEVSGVNGSSGGITASPKAAGFGNDTMVRALVLVPNGTLQTGHRTKASGALFGRDVTVNLDAVVTFEDGFTGTTCGSCDDGNPCTEDTCSGGTCSHAPAASGTPCDDGDACTQADTCQSGACVGGSPRACPGVGPCRLAATCEPSSGACTALPAPVGTPCDDGDPCNGVETCDGAGACRAGALPTLDDGNACTADTCDLTSGVLHTPLPEGTLCSDGDPCNGEEACTTLGVCGAGAPLAIDDGNPCTVDACDPVLGAVHLPAAAGAPCGGAPDFCHGAPACDGAGACVVGAPLACTTDNPCMLAACDPSSGCTLTPVADGTACDSDMNACNGQSTCVAGQCELGQPPGCASADPCVVGSCEPTTGCVLTPAPPGTPGCTPVLEPPPLDSTTAVRMSDATAFLYTGSSPVQIGVASGTILPERVAVVRGRVLDADGATPKSGATVSILGHPELGHTLTRADGQYDLAVNGGTSYVVDVHATGYLPVQRRAKLDWHGWAVVEDMILTHMQSSPDLLVVGSPTPQVVRGLVTPAGEDADGARQAVLVFPEHTHLTNYVVPDGTSLEVQITEYTRGPQGPQRMPGELPPTVGYTYAVELGFPAATAAGVTDVQFDRDVALYVDNFTHYPVGETVPLGYYDRTKGAWSGEKSGRILKVLTTDGGAATVDVTGDGVADTGAELTALGITTSELQTLAAQYAASTELWRVTLRHFSAWDCNWGFGPPDDAKAPPDARPRDGEPTGRESEKCGSIIGCEPRTLGESIPVVGTPFSLRYKSNRAPG